VKPFAMSGVLLLASALLPMTDASAQVPTAPAIRWVEIDSGGGMLGGAALGTADASLRANERTAQSYRLFTADHQFNRTSGFHVRAARPWGARWAIEGGLAVSHPVLRADVREDVEGAPAITITETVEQYFFEAGLAFAIHELQIGRLRPFATAGAGYLRQLHDGQTVIEHGQLFQAGGGVKYPFVSRATGAVRSAGLRGDVRAYLLRRGVSVEDRPRPHIAISGSVFVGF
jgi:hypothetical protein